MALAPAVQKAIKNIDITSHLFDVVGTVTRVTVDASVVVVVPDQLLSRPVNSVRPEGKSLFVNESVVARPTRVSEVVGKVSKAAPLLIEAIIGSVSVLFVNVSVVSIPTSVVLVEGRVSVPPFVMIGDVNVLFVRVWVAAAITTVPVPLGKVITWSTDCAVRKVVEVLAVALGDSNMMDLGLTSESANLHEAVKNILFASVSVVDRATSVSVAVGRVTVPVLEMVEMMGAVSVLFVNV